MSALRDFDKSYHKAICGIDEVGRGPLAGPVMAACVHIPETALVTAPALLEMTDSKKLSAKKRVALSQLIKQHCLWGLGEASTTEIDEINILQATFLAMCRASVALLEKAPDLQHSLVLIDGNKVPRNLPFSQTQSIVKGDSKSLSIAAASIIAKVTRDDYMTQIAQDYPHYGWHSNSGYGAKIHLEAIEKYGATPHHRMSFAPLKYMD